jgi:hypothetical protein
MMSLMKKIKLTLKGIINALNNHANIHIDESIYIRLCMTRKKDDSQGQFVMHFEKSYRSIID